MPNVPPNAIDRVVRRIVATGRSPPITDTSFHQLKQGPQTAQTSAGLSLAGLIIRRNSMKIFTPIAIAAATAAAATVGLAATPAQASTSSSGCTVTPRVVRFYDYNANNKKRVLLRIDITCHVNRWVHVQQQGWEDDNTPSDHTDDRWYTNSKWVRVNANTTQRINSITVMPNTPNDGAEELYQRARYQVRTIEQYPVTSEWTQWEATPYRSIPN